MKPVRTVTARLVLAVTSSVFFAGLCGVTEKSACAQTWMGRGPSMLAAPTGYGAAPVHGAAPAYGAAPVYDSALGYYTAPAVNSPPASHPAQAYRPAAYGTPQTLSPSVRATYPSSTTRAAHPQAAPYQYGTTNERPSWPYVQTNDGRNGGTSVLLGRGETLAGPQLAPPQVDLPAPAPLQQTPYGYGPMQQSRPTIPMYQTPNYQVQPQSMPGYAMPGYAMPGYAMPGYTAGGAACDVWTSGDAATYGPPAVRNWFGSAGGLVMTRAPSSHYTFSYGTGNEADQRTDSRHADMNWAGGFDARFGRYFNCQRNAIEAVYWGIFPVSQSTQTVSANVSGNLNGILNWNSLDYGGNTAGVYVNVAPGDDGIHRVTRDYAFQNVELNLWRFCGSCSGGNGGAGKCSGGNCGSCNNNCSRLKTNWLAGVRYFRFDERLLFASDANDVYITNQNDEIYYNIDIHNQLLGFQVGNEAQYCVTDRLTANLSTKLGIFGNQIDHVSEIGGNLGVATINNGPFVGEDFYVNNSKTDVAFLGEANLGLRYCFNCRWTGTIGYRVVAVTGVALPADQIYPDLRGINDVEIIDSSRCLILHGGYAGLEYNW